MAFSSLVQPRSQEFYRFLIEILWCGKRPWYLSCSLVAKLMLNEFVVCNKVPFLDKSDIMLEMRTISFNDLRTIDGP